MKASSIRIEAFGPYEAHHRSKLIWYGYLDRLVLVFGIGCLVGAGLMLVL
jgi:hypothetical protein